MSFVTRKGAGVGVGEGSGVGRGDALCAREDAMFKCGVARAAAPSAGTSFTNVRRFRSLLSALVNDFPTRCFPDLSFCIVMSHSEGRAQFGVRSFRRFCRSRPVATTGKWSYSKGRRQAAADESGDRSPHSKTTVSTFRDCQQGQPCCRISS